MRNLLRPQPGGDCSLYMLIPLAAGGRQQVLVEGADQHEHTVTAALQDFDRALECLPLQGPIQVYPRIILLKLGAFAAFEPRNWLMAQPLIWRRQVPCQGP